jgi:hypothetical protein
MQLIPFGGLFAIYWHSENQWLKRIISIGYVISKKPIAFELRSWYICLYISARISFLSDWTSSRADLTFTVIPSYTNFLSI